MDIVATALADEQAVQDGRKHLAEAAQVSMTNRKQQPSSGAFALSDISVAAVVGVPDPFFTRRARR